MKPRKFKFEKNHYHYHYHYHELKHFIDGFAELEFDWNGNNAEPFDNVVINNAREFLELVKDYAEIISVFPTAIKAIQFEYEYKGVYCEIEVHENHFELYSRLIGSSGVERSFHDKSSIQEAAEAFLKILMDEENEDYN